jgi:thiamine pyrophosphate-dependent acetolactate synthase large subunit-like protein
MCLAELRTAVRENLRIRVVVFDDAELSLIKIKQVQRGYAPTGVQMGQLDWELLGTALGLVAKTAATEAELLQVLADTADCNGPVLIAAKIDPTSYQAMINALRG